MLFTGQGDWATFDDDAAPTPPPMSFPRPASKKPPPVPKPYAASKIQVGVPALSAPAATQNEGRKKNLCFQGVSSL